MVILNEIIFDRFLTGYRVWTFSKTLINAVKYNIYADIKWNLSKDFDLASKIMKNWKNTSSIYNSW